MNVLVVDDHPENRYLLEAVLGGNGHRVISTSNGAEALAKVRREPFDLIVSDILMPQMDGFEFCREVKRESSTRPIPFVFYTATYTDTRDMDFGLSLGADRYLVKPMEPELLLATLLDVVKNPRLPVEEAPSAEDPAFLKQYNSRLVAKLEKKMLDLEEAHRALQEEFAVRERLELQLRQSQKMEAIGRLAGGIAHDFNNILGGISGFAELARMEVGNRNAVQTHLEGIITAVQRARDLVQQILTFSRRKERKSRPLRLADALDDALKLLRASLPANVELRREFNPETPAIRADLTEIHQLATNLVTNAWHALGQATGGKIAVEVAPFTADTAFAKAHPDVPPGKYVRFSVHDNGCGMDQRTIEHIFEPFFSTKAPGKGSGLGLSVVHGIVKACDGAIVVNSKVGCGTTFDLYFPALDVAVEEVDPEPSLPRVGTGQRILFIDDDVTLTTLGSRFLTRLGYVVETANNPLVGLARFRDEPFDLVLTDLTMPFATGLEVARECRSLKPEIPVMLMTGFNPTLQPGDLKMVGIVDVILKPYSIQMLGDAVANALLPQG